MESWAVSPLATGGGLAGLGFFLWALRDGQYDVLKGDAERILSAEDKPRITTAVKAGSSAPPQKDANAP